MSLGQVLDSLNRVAAQIALTPDSCSTAITLTRNLPLATQTESDRVIGSSARGGRDRRIALLEFILLNKI